MQKTLIIYETKYGTTEKIAKYLSLIMGPAKICRVEEFTDAYKHFDLYIIATPVYEERIDEKLLKFLLENLEWIRTKSIALLCCCVTGPKGEKYLNPIKNILSDNIIYSKAVGGKIKIERLEDDDYNQITNFLKRLNQPISDIDMFKLEEIVNFALHVKELRDIEGMTVSEDEFKKVLNEFLASHNTCTLSTAHGSSVRGTPIEYLYKNGYLYMVTEGGEKFAHILLNPMVSVSVYDTYQGMNKLNGVQLSGRAELVEMTNKEYKEVISKKGIKSDQLTFFPAYLNLLKIKPYKVELISTKFTEKGYSARQVYLLNNK